VDIEKIKNKMNWLNIRIDKNDNISNINRMLYKYTLSELEKSFNLYLTNYNENETNTFIKQMDNDTESEIIELLDEIEDSLNKENI
jgi:hypothetical protein